jgi:hypothetical protein
MGREPRHAGAVRGLETAGRMDDAKSGSYAGQAHVRLDHSSKRESLKLMVFLRDRTTKRSGVREQ